MSEAWRSAPLAGETVKSLEEKAQAWRSAPLVGKAPPQPDPIPDKPWHSMFTGEGRTEFPDAPGLIDLAEGLDDRQKVKMAAAYLVAPDPAQIADIAVNTIPGAKRKQDIHGNLMIEFDGRGYYVNPPGAEKTDVAQFVGQVLAFTPAGKLAAIPKTLGKRAVVAGAGGAATSVGLDLAAEEMGSEQGVSGWRAAFAGAGGIGGEFMAPALMRFWRAVRGKPKLFDEATQTLTDKGRKAAEAAGFDPDKMGPELERMFAGEAAEATGQAGARVRGKEFRIPMTRGQATGGWKQIAKEEATRHGARGEKAGDIMRQFDLDQQMAMRGARGQVQSSLGRGETRVARAGQAGEFVGPGLARRSASMKALVDKAYKQVPGDATIAADGFRGLWRRGAESVHDMPIDPDLTPAAVKGLRMLRKMESSTRRQAKKARITGAKMQKLEVERRKLQNLYDAAKNDTDRRAVASIKDAYDDWLDDAFDNALMEGSDPKTLALMKEARARNAEYRAKFGGGGSRKPVDKAIQNIISGDRTPEQVMNLVWGKGQLGAKDESVQIIRRIKDIAGEGSEEMLAMKEAGWLKLSKEISEDGFSPRKFRTRLNKVLEENRSLMEELYSPKELNMFERFRDEVMRTVPPESATNPPKTAYTVARLAREWLGRIGTTLTFSGSPLGGATFFTLKRAPEVMGTMAAKKAVRPLPLPRAKAPLFVSTGMAGARLAAEEVQQPRDVEGGQ